MRTLLGMVMAWITSVATAFLAGCIYAFTLMGGDAADVVNAAGTERKDALTFLFFVGGTTAIAAAVVAVITIVTIAWPLTRILRHLGSVSRSAYVVAGFVASVVIASAIVVLQLSFGRLAVQSEYYFEVVTVLIVGPIAMLTLWLIVRPDRNSTNIPLVGLK